MAIINASADTHTWLLSLFYMTSRYEIATSNAKIHCDKAR